MSEASTFVEHTKVCVDKFGDDSETFADDRKTEESCTRASFGVRVGRSSCEACCFNPVCDNVSLGEP